MKKKTTFFALFFVSILATTLYSQESNSWNVDISQCTRVNERFFSNNNENKINSPVNYYDRNGNHVLRILFDENGQERSRAVKKYNDLNEMIEYSYWDRVTGSNQWRCWIHGVVEKITENNILIFLTKERRYSGEYKLIKKNVYNINGKLISEHNIDPDGFDSYRQYNDKNDVIYYKYQNEKSNGIREETYEIEYDSNFNKTKIKTIEDNRIVSETTNNFNENNLLIQSTTINHLRNIQTRCIYAYDSNNNLIEEKYIDNNNIEIFKKYYQYDSQNRIIRHGEKSDHYERYWIFEYF